MFVKKNIEAYGEDFKRDFDEKRKMSAKQFQKKIDEDERDGEYVYKETYLCKSSKGIRITFEIQFQYENNSDAEDETDECLPNMDTCTPLISVGYVDYTVASDKMDITIAKYNGFTEYDWVDSLIKPYIMCSCGRSIAQIKGFCNVCYVMTTEQEDVCCCCHENEGVWVELVCTHLIHQNCWRKIESKHTKEECLQKCPLCRTESPYNKYTIV
jgi:hypothetical protein